VQPPILRLEVSCPTSTATGTARANFIFALLELATTYCVLAERSDLHSLPSHLKNALRTYENVIRFISLADLGSRELSDITFDVEQLKLRLEALRQH